MARLGRTAATIITYGNYFCLSQRLNTEAFRGYFQFPGGRADSDAETFKDVAQREVFEEMNLVIPQDRFVEVGLNPHDEDCFQCMMFHVELTPFESPQNTEPDKMTDWRWYSIHSMRDLQLIDGVQKMAEKVWEEKQLTAAKNSVK